MFTYSFHTSFKKITAIFSLALVLLIGVGLNVAPTAQAVVLRPADVTPSANPAWPERCGLKIGLLVDRSNSIDSSEGAQLKTAAKGFVDALTGTPSQISVAQFRKTASQTLGLTPVINSTGPNSAQTVKNTIDGYNFGTNDDDGSTNWEAAFYSQQSIAVDVVVILTDGNPTKRGLDGSGGNGYDDSSGYNLDAGVTRANELKAQGKRIVAIGIGSDVDTDNLKAVSGPTVNSDYFTSSFSTLNTKLQELATKICGGTVTVQKQVKNADGTYTPTNGWDYIATNAVDNTKTTAGSGTAEFKFENAPKSTVITETLKPGYALESIECKKNNVVTGSVSGLGVSLTINSNDIISCVFKNKPTEGTVTVTKLVKNADGTYTPTNGWDYTATNAVDNTKTTAGSGTATFSYTNTPKSSTITETVKSGYSVESVECKNSNNQVVSSSTNAAVTVNVPTNDAISCVFKNARDTGTIQVKKVSVGANGAFNFTSNSALGNFNLTTVGGTAQTAVTSVNTGTYDITEAVPAGWSLTGATCTGATPSVSGSKVTVTVAKGVNVVCTFTNTRDTGTIQVKKVATGGNGTFSFTSSSALGNFNLTTVGGSAQTAVTSVNTGTYDITEAVPAGWTLAGATCTGATPSVSGSKVTVTVAKGANVVCTFTNSRDTATLRVVKNASGGNGTFSFTSNSALGNFNLTTVGGTAQTAVTTIDTGVYDITENSAIGWSLTGATCTGATPSVVGSKVTITAIKGANIVCTFSNNRDTGKLIVKKVATGGNGAFSFTSNTPLGNFGLTTVSGAAQTQQVNLVTGTYNLNETVPAGWTLVSSGCVVTNFQPVPGFIQPGTFINSVTVAKGEEVECTFTNSRDTGTLQVKKVSVGGNGTFSFTSSSALGNFNLTTVGGSAQTAVTSVNTGTYDITEAVPAGWTLAGATCTGATPSVSGSKVTVTVAKGANVVCTFTNSRDTATLRVVKNASGGNGTFSFTSNSALGNFNLTTVGGTAQTNIVAVDTGTYDITETVPAGWSLTGATCTGATPTVVGSKVTITATKGAAIVCTFNNSRDTGTIQVKKVATGGNGTFSFTSSSALGNFNLTTVGGTAQTAVTTVDTGSYDITESAATGWSLTGATCTGATPSVSGSKVTVTVAKGANVVCTFNNSRDTGTIQVKKVATGGNGTFSFTSNSALGNFNLTTVGGTAQTAVTTVDTGSYDITESAAAGWSLTGATCTGATPTVVGSKVTVTVSKGANVVCTFTNSRDTGTIQVKKVATGGNGTFSFTSNSALGNFNLTTVGGSAQTAVTTVDTGSYDITESATTGWTLDSASCTGATPSVSGSKVTVTVAKGANVVCTFNNSRDTGTIQVKKVATGGNGTFSFTSNSALGNFNLTTVGGSAQTAVTTVDTGSYDITESAKSGWTLGSLDCGQATVSKQGSTISVSVAKGANVVCTFNNSRDTGTLTIQKIAIGGNGTFKFESKSPLGDFDLETTLGLASTEQVTVDTGTYDIYEIVPANWELTNVSCSNENVTRSEDMASITVDKDEDVVCTFTNQRDKGSLRIVVIANGGEGTFPFETDTPFGDFDLTTDSGQASTDEEQLDTGTYNLAEMIPTGWTLDSISCQAEVDEGEGEGDLGDIFEPRSAVIETSEIINPTSLEINKGDRIVCTFVNSKDPVVLGTVVVQPPAVKGISKSNLPVTGSNSGYLVGSAILVLITGAGLLLVTRRRNGLIR